MRLVCNAFLQNPDYGWQVGWRDDRRTLLRTMDELKDATCAPLRLVRDFVETLSLYNNLQSVTSRDCSAEQVN